MKKNITHILKIIVLILLVIALIVFVWCNFARVIRYHLNDLEYVTIRYYDSQAEKYAAFDVTNQENLEEIYNALNNAKVKKVRRFAATDAGADAGWEIKMYFKDGVECYDDTCALTEYGIRKYIRTGNSNGYVLLSGEEVHKVVSQWIQLHQSESN